MFLIFRLKPLLFGLALLLLLRCLVISRYQQDDKTLYASGLQENIIRVNTLSKPRDNVVNHEFGMSANFENSRGIHHHPGFITVGLTIINKRGQSNLDDSFVFKMTKNLRSLLTHSSGDPLHFVIITDKNSIKNVVQRLDNIIRRFTSEGVFSTLWRRVKSVPRMRFSFVDCEEIVKVNRPFFSAMKNESVQNQFSSPEASYTEDLFYIAPVYHQIFSNLDKIIFLDSKDLEFRSDIRELDEEFEKMGEDALIGIAPDNTPHYRNILKTYISNNPDSKLGLPGPMQGFNSGVVLYRQDISVSTGIK